MGKKNMTGKEAGQLIKDKVNEGLDKVRETASETKRKGKAAIRAIKNQEKVSTTVDRSRIRAQRQIKRILVMIMKIEDTYDYNKDINVASKIMYTDRRVQ